MRSIGPYMAEYIKLLFKKDAFGEGEFDDLATNYLIDLSEDINFVKNIRNYADHSYIITCRNAEAVCDALVKTEDYKILCSLLDKISPEYIQKSLETPIKSLENAIL